MDKDTTYYVDMINKYFAGEASSEEISILSIWLKSDPANQKLFKEYQQTWSMVDQHTIDSSINIDEEWNNLNFKLERTALSNQDQKIIRLDSTQNSSRNLFLRLARIAAVFIAIALSASILFFLLRKSDEPKTISVFAKNQGIERILSDGTSVTLNSGRLDYPEMFSGNKRIVKLSGEAYFKVKHDYSKPFMIEAGEIIIKVLGTSFYVNVNSVNGNVEVILTSGSVAVYKKDKPEEKVILSPGEKAEFSKVEMKISKDENKDENYMAFKTKKLVFVDTPLNKIVLTLNKVYHSDILIKDSNVKNCPVTATFDNKSLDAILNVLQATIDVNIVKSGSSIEISGDGCK